MRHPDKNIQLLVIWLLFEFGLKDRDGLFVVTVLEMREAQVQPQSRHRRCKRQRFAVIADSFRIVLLAGFKQTEMSVRLGVRRLLLRDGLPGRLGLSISPLLLERNSRLSRIGLRKSRQTQTGDR